MLIHTCTLTNLKQLLLLYLQYRPLLPSHDLAALQMR